MKIARYGWLPDRLDHRDLKFKPRLRAEPLPDAVDLRPSCPPVYDQGSLGSCTANAIAAALSFDAYVQQQSTFRPSRLFIYWGERDMEGNAATDSGAYIRDGIKFVNRSGACAEENWPYDVSQFAVKPPLDCWENATEKAMIYESLDNTDAWALMSCLADGLPFVFGFSVFDAFESDYVRQTGIVELPDPNDAPIGGHAVLAVGYDKPSHRLLVRNSWGDSWGQKGYFTIPMAYLTNPNLADDFWVIRRVGNEQPSNNPPLPST